jgi:hypothetical protein
MDPFVTLGDQLSEAAQRRRAAARAPRRRRWRLSHPLSVLVAGVLLAGGAASAAVVLTSRPSAPLVGVLGPSQYAIDMSPDLQAGGTGWCVGVISTEQRRFRGWSEECGGAPGLPIVAESFEAPEPKHATLNWAITTAAVAAVRFGDHVVRTRSEPRLPNGFRAAVEIVAPGYGPGPGRQRVVRRVDGTVDVQTRPRPVEALNARGQVIRYLAPEPLQSGTVLGHAVPAKRRIPWWLQKTVYWAPPQAPPNLPCSIHSRPISGPEPQWGNVATGVRHVAGVQGSAFISCADTEFYWHHWPLEAAVLLDAARPGSEPAAFPQMQPVSGHPGVFDAPGGVQGHLTGRRTGDAWLVVQGGDSLEQRLAVLNDLTVVPPATLWR